jgi:transcriptional regulator with XRE-family HTH domain
MGAADLEGRRRRLQRSLREAREEKGFRQADLAQRLGLPQSFVSKFETGERRLEFVMVEAICGALGIPFEDFVRQWVKER